MPFFLPSPGLDEPLGFLMDQDGDCNFVTASGLTEPAVTLQTDGLGLDNVAPMMRCQGRGSITSLVSETSGFFRGVFLASALTAQRIRRPSAVKAKRYAYDSFGSPRITGSGPDQIMDTGDDVVSDHFAFNQPYAFTGRDEPSDEVRGFTSGAEAYLTKRVTPTQLLDTVEMVLQDVGTPVIG